MTDAEKIIRLTALVRREYINDQTLLGFSVYCAVCGTRAKTETHKPNCVLQGTKPTT